MERGNDDLARLDELQREVSEKGEALRPKGSQIIFKLSRVNGKIAAAKVILEARGRQAAAIAAERGEISKLWAKARTDVSRAISDTSMEKGEADRVKDKVTEVAREVDKLIATTAKTNAMQEVASTKRGFLERDNQELNAELTDLREKNERQTRLMDEVRAERDRNHHQCEEVEAENRRLAEAVRQLEDQNAETLERFEGRLRDTVLEHATVRQLLAESEVMTSKCEALKKEHQMVRDIVSQLETEERTLRGIIASAETAHKRQELEQLEVARSRDKVLNVFRQRAATFEDVHAQVTTIEREVRDSSRAYRAIVDEICSLREEFVSVRTRSFELEAGVRAFWDLQDSESRLSVALQVGREQLVRLTHEFSVPRNVHRWRVLETVHPEFVKQIRLRSRLLQKLDSHHRLLCDLLAERDRLAHAKRAHEPKKLANSFVETETQRLKQRLADLEVQIATKAQELDAMRGKPGEEDRRAAVSALRRERGERLCSTIRAKTRLSEMTGDPAERCFMTEVVLDFPKRHGGGFEMARLPPPRLIRPKVIGRGQSTRLPAPINRQKSLTLEDIGPRVGTGMSSASRTSQTTLWVIGPH